MAYTLACAGSNGFTTNCSSINFDSENRTITLIDTTVEASTAGSSLSTASLTINGTITWVAGDEKPINENSNNKSVNGALTDITGVWQEDDPYGYNSELGYSDEVYEIYKADGTYLRFDYYASLACYENFMGTYEDFGSGNISRDEDDPYNFSIEANVMTVTYLDNVNILTKSNLTESDFVPICDY